MVHAVVPAQDQRPPFGGAAGAARMVRRGGADGLAHDGGGARRPAPAVEGDAHDRGEPLREGQQAPVRHERRAAAGGLCPNAAERRGGGAGSAPRPAGRGARGGAGFPPHAGAHLRPRGRQGVPRGRGRRQPGGRAGAALLPLQKARKHRPAAVVAAAGSAPLRHGAGPRRGGVAEPLSGQRGPWRGGGVTPGSRRA